MHILLVCGLAEEARGVSVVLHHTMLSVFSQRAHIYNITRYVQKAVLYFLFIFFNDLFIHDLQLIRVLV